MKKTLLNVGCGKKFHNNWLNVDIAPTEPEVTPMDLTRKWKIEDNSMDCVYHSHVLEHVPKEAVKGFVSECYRVLKPGGVIRVVAPDLEVIARNYIKFLESNLEKEDEETKANYHWTLLEMYDQTTRNQSGGDMHGYLSQKNMINRDFVVSRTSEINKFSGDDKSAKTLGEKINKFRKMRFSVKMYYIKSAIRDFIFTKLLPGKKYYKIGLFRMRGETHQWMYDRYSISELLKECGFTEIRKTTANDSRIKDWGSYYLDSNEDGKTYKPDSIFMEGIK
jgi:predicted SAM-dependent methyltransferase